MTEYRKLVRASFSYERARAIEAMMPPWQRSAVRGKLGVLAAHRFTGQSLVPFVALYNPNFIKGATEWEKLFSALTKGHADPVVDEQMAVVGHYAWFGGSSIFAPVGHRNASINELLVDGNPIKVIGNGMPQPSRSTWWAYDATESQFRLLTDPDGNVLASTGWDIVGVEPDDISPLDLIGFGRLGAAAAGGIGRGIKNLLGRVLVRRAIEKTADKVHPALARALQTQLNLQNHKLTRSVQLLQKPTRFRHTIRSDNPPATYYQIEKSGSLTYSTGAGAHYGEGVYVWEATKTGVGRYIDIEVPAGTAAELLKVEGVGSWYRLVSASATNVSIKIVGHNFSQAELEFARKLLEIL
jgi:hypothetical protein